MNSSLAFAILFGLSGVAAIMGAVYYLRPELIVKRRIKDHHYKEAQKDVEFSKWLQAEFAVQINRTKRMGLIILIFEAIWMVVIYSLWQKGLG